MSITTVFTHNRSQAVRLPADVRLPEGVKKVQVQVQVRARGMDRIISPVGHTWDAFFLNGPQASDDFMAERATQKQAGRMAISAIKLSELYHGAERRPKVAQNLAAVEEFASLLEVLPDSAKASQHYGAIRAELEKAGRPIGVNDLHIAAHARREGLTLVTNHMGEFERVPGLLLENWVGA